ncbi:hypothetical protein RA279_28055 [Pseudomonas syringae pv. tagetis]|uniref:hypothetical protein n=1 Tax=Pseudomonas syringae group genomosp. 7 TaxID=251699 RepID=UPI00377018C0
MFVVVRGRRCGVGGVIVGVGVWGVFGVCWVVVVVCFCFVLLVGVFVFVGFLCCCFCF